MNRKSTLTLLLISILSITACNIVPLTGRRQVSLVPEAQITEASALQYRQMISQSRLSTDRRSVERVRTVGERIARAATQYLRSQNQSAAIEGMNWEFNVIQNAQVNAFCMPGGKVAVFSGLLSLVSSDAELASVISHEVSHAIAKHSNERISQEMLRRLGGQLLGAAIADQSSMLQTVIGQAYGVGTQVLISLPYSRVQEYEADQMGLIFMSMAGYDPRAAITFWEKMSSRTGSNTNDFLSTHPSDSKRVKALQDYMPTALKYYSKH